MSLVFYPTLLTNSADSDLVTMFQEYGMIMDIRIYGEKGFGFVRYDIHVRSNDLPARFDTHENAAMAILSLNGVLIQGRQIRCSWGRNGYDIPIVMNPNTSPTTPYAYPYISPFPYAPVSPNQAYFPPNLSLTDPPVFPPRHQFSQQSSTAALPAGH